MSTLKARVTFLDTQTNEDSSSNTFIVVTALAPTTADYTAMETGITTFYNISALDQTHYIAYYLSADLSRGAGASQIQWYDVSGHLDGSPAGSPVRITTWTLGAAGAGNNLDARLAACLALRATYPAGVVEHGPAASMPTADAAKDVGAPTTHTGLTRPRAQYRGRLYLGPLNSQATFVTPTAQQTWQSAFSSDVTLGAGDLLSYWASLTNAATWSVWSRRRAATAPITQGYLDEAPSSQRRRGDITAFRVHPWAALA
jgi:hypothetical protein